MYVANDRKISIKLTKILRTEYRTNIIQPLLITLKLTLLIIFILLYLDMSNIKLEILKKKCNTFWIN